VSGPWIERIDVVAEVNPHGLGLGVFLDGMKAVLAPQFLKPPNGAT
jgi:hypothetical protein